MGQQPIFVKPPPSPDTPLPRSKAPGWFELLAQTLGGAIGLPPLGPEDYDSPEGGQSIDRAGAIGELLSMGLGAGTLGAVLAGKKAAKGTIGEAVGHRIPNPITAYHGSPHDFDQFSLSKIGTGEGAQAYGHGLYFAESEDVARGYRQRLSDPDLHVEYAGRQLSKQPTPQRMALIQVDTVGHAKAVEQAENWLKTLESFGNVPEYQLKDQRQHIQWLRGIDPAKLKVQDAGRTYEVNLHATPDELLDWDKPLSEQPQKVREVWEEAYRRRFGRKPELSRDISAAEAYNMLGSGSFPEATKALSGSPVKGIQYLDQGSRTTGQVVKIHGKYYFSGSSEPFETFEAAEKAAEAMKPRTRNFVIFDDQLIEIKRKFGFATTAAAAEWVRQNGGVVQSRDDSR